LKINLAKSKIILVGDAEDVKGLARILGCRVSSLPMKFLGFPLGASYKAALIWNGIIEKMESRLAVWKRPYLSKGDGITLMKTTISNLPTYYLSRSPVPVGVTNMLEKLQRDLLL
jgi:hypothetical protein